MTSKKDLSERDICTQFIVPALKKVGWDLERQVREEVSFTDGRIYVRGTSSARGSRKRADFILYYKPNIPIAVIEAKDNSHNVGDGIQQALGYAATLDIPVAFSSNGDGFVEHDRTALSGTVERNLSLDNFPSPEELWRRYKLYNRQESEQAWKVSIDTLTANNYSLDINNPHIKEIGHSYTSADLLELLHLSFQKSDTLLQTLRKEISVG